MTAIQFDLKLPPQNVSWSDYLAVATAADKLAFGTFWTFDHVYPISGDLEASEHECYATMAALAAVTTRIRIGALVSGVIYRNPAMQIKLATQIDVISNGRFDFGIGAGWAEREFRSFNLPFPEAKDRIATLRETLDLAKLVWSGDPRKKVSYFGKHVQATDLFMNPQPVQLPHPPIVIGGAGEQLTLRVVARHADVWHGFGDVATLQRKVGLIDGYAPNYGRRGNEIVKSTDCQIWVGDLTDAAVGRISEVMRRTVEQVRGAVLAGSPAAIEEKLRPIINAGISRIVVPAYGPEFADNWRRVSEEIIPRFARG
ncbi:MAG TPA: LLM class flavin-dependent oxidoreductase [Chloroflexota bacterium]|nr:LLM class flavin-dependent oxidoreductase [Chloroflexota bacterium]